MKITSVNNEMIKETAKLLKGKYREETGLFLIEGEKGVKEAIQAGLEIKHIFVENGYLEFSGTNVIETTEAVLAKISDTKSAPKVVAVAKQPITRLSNLKNAKRIVLLENIKDAGNLGTILRTAVAFNIDGIILFGETVDLYNPKTVRSAVGNLWKIPVIKIDKLEVLKNQFSDFEKVVTLPKKDGVITLSAFNPKEKTLIMFGSEADGLSNELINLANTRLTIEMNQTVESLNLSVSVALIMYKLRN